MNPEWIGMTAATLTTLSFAPQAIRVIRTGDTAAISLTMYVLFVAGIACWEIYGILIESKPVIIANAVTILLASVILWRKVVDLIAYRKKITAPTIAPDQVQTNIESR